MPAVVCITGYPCSGKSTLAGMLGDDGFAVVELGDLVRERMKTDPAALKFAGDIRGFSGMIREVYGRDVVASWAVEKIKKLAAEKIVITGLRTVEELARIKAAFPNALLISVNAPEHVRFQRMLSRGRRGDPRSYEDFLKRDEKEREGLLAAGEETEGLDTMISKADYHIENTGTLSDLKKAAYKILESLGE